RRARSRTWRRLSRRGEGRDSVLECAAERSGAALSMRWEGKRCVDWERRWSRGRRTGSRNWRRGFRGVEVVATASWSAPQSAAARRVGRRRKGRGACPCTALCRATPGAVSDLAEAFTARRGSRQRPGVRRRAQRRGAFDEVGREEVRGLGKAVVAWAPDGVSELAEGFSRRGGGRDSVVECAAERSGAARWTTAEGTGCLSLHGALPRDAGRGLGLGGGFHGAERVATASWSAPQSAAARRFR